MISPIDLRLGEGVPPNSFTGVSDAVLNEMRVDEGASFRESLEAIKSQVEELARRNPGFHINAAGRGLEAFAEGVFQYKTVSADDLALFAELVLGKWGPALKESLLTPVQLLSNADQRACIAEVMTPVFKGIDYLMDIAEEQHPAFTETELKPKYNQFKERLV